MEKILAKKINSNIELLRIFAFFFVCVIHVTCILIDTNGLLIDHSVSWYYSSFIRFIAAPAVPIFILISGYINSLNKKNYNKIPFKRLFIPVLFYFPFLLINNIIPTGKSIMESVLDILNCTGAFYHLWYIFTFIFIIIIFSFIDKNVLKSDTIQFKYLIIMLMILGINHAFVVLFNIHSIMRVISFDFLYLLLLYFLGYIIENSKISFKKVNLIILFLFNVILSYFIFLVINRTGNTVDIRFITDLYSFPNILNAILIFLFFKDLNIDSKFINKLGSLTYGAYVIHIFFIWLLQTKFHYLSFVGKNFYFIYELLFILLVMICSLLIEYFRQIIFKKIIYRRKK